ncbi:unnamed protein product [Penicillium salamii]|nr:unnamed protein product [Penicillium salamii]CAG8066281.1 unnamed protein product [Penicillium salamii]CAG8261358.1 unnamed protein product [Penicillium salamii]
MGINGQTALVTGASMGIGEATARALAKSGANLILLSRSEDKLAKLTDELKKQYPQIQVIYRTADVGNYEEVDTAVESSIIEIGGIDILINNAGLAIGAPKAFHELEISEILTMNSTNVNGPMFVTHSVLNRSMLSRKSGTIINVTSVTGLEVPPFTGEAVYHSNKAAQEGFTNSLRNELCGTNIRVLALRPGVVAGHFHAQRVGNDQAQYDEFLNGYTPLLANDIADAAIYMLNQPLNISVKALDVVPSAQRSLTVFDRKWNERTGQ